MLHIKELEEKAAWVRRQVLQMAYKTGKGHIGSTFSCTDIFVALYYGGILRWYPKYLWEDRDRLVVGKGHACLALYNIWADLGTLGWETLDRYGSNGSFLSGQLNFNTPGVDFNTGSLGHAIGVAAGMALAAKMNNKDYKVIALIGDGECDEGSVWESAMFASRYQLDNLIGIVDRNKLSVTDVTYDQRLTERFVECGWECRTIDGHSFYSILAALGDLDNLKTPLMIIADTIKGKGVSFMENNIKWHHSTLSKEEYEQAMKELS